MKMMMRMTKSVAVLLMLAGGGGCITGGGVDGLGDWLSSINRNEVVYSFDRILAEGIGVSCIEQTTVSTDGYRVSDVYVDAAPFIVQTYRIGNRTVTDCRWIYCLDDRSDFVSDEEYQTSRNAYKNFRDKQWAMRDVFRLLPNCLEQDSTPPQLSSYSSMITVTSMGWDGPGGPPVPYEEGITVWDYEGARQWAYLSDKDKADFKPFCTWNHWGVWRWAGDIMETPAEVTAVCQALRQMVSHPEYKKHYRSYVRAIPLFTKEDIETERNTRLIELEKLPCYVQYSVRSPYVLFPVYGWGRPFPMVRKYKPGDKFKVREGGNYFLIETFKGK